MLPKNMDAESKVRFYNRREPSFPPPPPPPPAHIVYSHGWLKGRGRVGSSINFSNVGTYRVDRGLRGSFPRNDPMISRDEIRIIRLLLSTFIDQQSVHVKDIMIYPLGTKNCLPTVFVFLLDLISWSNNGDEGNVRVFLRVDIIGSAYLY